MKINYIYVNSVEAVAGHFTPGLLRNRPIIPLPDQLRNKHLLADQVRNSTEYSSSLDSGRRLTSQEIFRHLQSRKLTVTSSRSAARLTLKAYEASPHLHSLFI
jgi:hypothetical protein